MVSLSIQRNSFIISFFQIAQTTLREKTIAALKFKAEVTVKVNTSSQPFEENKFNSFRRPIRD